MASDLLKSSSVVGLMTLLSRILGFVRDQVMAIVFGAGTTTDVFLVAFKIPNFLRRLFAEGAFAQAFVPVFTEYRETKSREALLDLAAHVSGALTIVLLIVTTLGVMLAPLLVLLFAPGFRDTPEQFELATRMLRITFPYLLFISLVAYAGSMLNTFGRFAIPSFTPVLLNVCMIAAALLFSPHADVPIVALAWGVFAAGALQLAFQLPFLARLGLLPRPRLARGHAGVSRILRLMAPAVLGSSVAQINLLLDTIIASFLAAGSLSWLYFADRLMEFPLGMLGATLGTVILPRLSSVHALDRQDDFRRTLDWALRLTLLIGIPAALGLALLAVPMISSLFEYGAFDAVDTRMASYSLFAYAFGLPAFLLVKIFAPAFFARHDTKTPVRIGIVALVSNMVYNIVLVVPMVLLDVTAPHTALAIATTLSAWQQAITLYRELVRRDIYRMAPSLAVTFRQVAIAGVAMAIVLYLLAGVDWSALAAGDRLLRLVVIIVAGAATYGVLLLVQGVRPRHLAGDTA